MNLITQIWNGAVKDFNAAEAWVDKEIAAVEKALPGATTTINAVGSDLKQAASDAIGLADTALAGIIPAAATAITGAADAALLAYTGPLALPLTPLTNDGIMQIEAALVSTINSWALTAKAKLAVNNGNAVATATGPAAVPAVPAAAPLPPRPAGS